MKTPRATLEQILNSYNKAAHLLSLAESVATKKLDLTIIEKNSDEQIISQLTSVKGIGKWTAEQFLFWHLERPDIPGVGDPAIKKQ